MVPCICSANSTHSVPIPNNSATPMHIRRPYATTHTIKQHTQAHPHDYVNGVLCQCGEFPVLVHESP